MSILNSNFTTFPQKKMMLIRLLATTLSPLGFALFNSILALLAIWFFPFITPLLLLNDPLQNENKYFLSFYYFCEFSCQFPNIISKTLCSAKEINQEDSKIADPILQGFTPKGQRSFFSKKCSDLPFLTQEAQTKK
jgi:hypothetical protein